MTGIAAAGRLFRGFAFIVILLTPAPVMAQITPLSVPDLPATIPLFPLPNVAVLPYLQLPLHVFEPRYREMLMDALNGDHVIGIVQIQPGFESLYDGRPPIFGIGCAAVIVATDRLPNGEFDIVLRGFMKFRIVGEVGSGPYRRARVEAIPEPLDDGARAGLRLERPSLEAAIATSLGIEVASLRLPAMPDDDLVNSIVMNFDFDTVDRQLLIEQDGVLARARKLSELLRKPPAGTAVPPR